MELSTIEHVLLARAALATGNPDALEALVRAALAAAPAVRDRARAVLLAETAARGIAVTGPVDAPATLDDYRALVARLTSGAAEPGQAPGSVAPRWLEAAARLRPRRDTLHPADAALERER
jgi:hypothetical protein